MSDFQKLLQKKKAERDFNVEHMETDPCKDIDMNISAKRKPLIESNEEQLTVNKKQKTNRGQIEDDCEKQKRRDKLARLAATLRNRDQADRGENVQSSPTPIQIQHNIIPKTSTDNGTSVPQKRSKWAAMAAERQQWDADYVTTTPQKEGYSKRENVKDAMGMAPSPRSARDQVSAALATMEKGQSQPLRANKLEDKLPTNARALPQKVETPKSRALPPKVETPKSRALPPKVETPVSNRFERKIEKNPSLVHLSTKAKVNQLIRAFSPCPGNVQTPQQKHIPSALQETREPTPEPVTVEPVTVEPVTVEPVTVRPGAYDFSLETDASHTTTVDTTVTSSTCSSPLPTNTSTESNLDMVDELPNMQSTQISDNMELFQLDDTKHDDNITGYQRGHSLSFVQNQFDFLGNSASNIKRDLSIKRNPSEILKDVEDRRVCFEADDTPKADKKLKPRKSLCIGGSADDMALVEFNPKSLQSFRKTQRLKRYEAKATASSIFKTSESGNNIISIDTANRKKQLEVNIQSEMSIIRQSSAALSVCTDKKHGKGTYTQVAAEKCLLAANKRFEVASAALTKLNSGAESPPGSLGRVTVGDIHLRTRYQETFESPQHRNSIYWVLAIVTVEDEVFVSEAKEVKNIREQKSVVLPVNFTFKNITADFVVNVTIYSMTTQVTPETRPKPKATNTLKLFGSKLGFKKVTGRDEKVQSSINPALFSPGGPNAVRKSNFRSIGIGKVPMESAQKFDQFRLSNTPWDSIINSVLAVKIEPKFTKSFEFCSFLTIRKGGDSGYGDWKRLWGVLSRDRITFWKYPEDRDDLPAEGHISLRRIINEDVKTAKRALTSRPNTLELYACPLKEGDKRNPSHFEGIVSDYDTKKYPRYLLSADTLDDKVAWCDALNRTLEDLRAWEKGLPPAEPDSMIE